MMGLRFLTIFSLLLPTCGYAATHASGGEILDYTLEVSFDIPASRISGVAKIPVEKGQEIRLNRGTLHLIDIRLDGQNIDFSGQDEIARIFPSRPGVMEIRYAGTFIFPKPPEGAIAQGAMNVPSDVVDGRGIFLTGIWYPQPDQMCHYHLTATLPDGYEAISEAETLRKTTNDRQTIFSFAFPHPLDSIHLIATNRYTMKFLPIFSMKMPGSRKRTSRTQRDTYGCMKTLSGVIPTKDFPSSKTFYPPGIPCPPILFWERRLCGFPLS